jgi:hypothetical protein
MIFFLIVKDFLQGSWSEGAAPMVALEREKPKQLRQ